MCSVWIFRLQGKGEQCDLKEIDTLPLCRCGSPWHRRNRHRLRPGQQHGHLQKAQAGTQGQAVLSQRHTSSHRTHPVHNPGQRKAELQQPPVRRTLRHRIVCPCPQRRAVQRQGTSPGTASPTDTNRNRHLRRCPASGTGAAAGHGKHPENRRTGGGQFCLYNPQK